MKFSPMDLTLQTFGAKMRGYDPDEVKRFLEAVSEDFQEIIKQNNMLKEKLLKKERDLQSYTEKEKMLQETLMIAQQASSNLQKTAQREKELLIAEAKVTADKILLDANLRLAQLLDQIKELKREKIQFESSLRRMIDSHLKMLDIQAEDVKDGIEERLKVFKGFAEAE